VKAALGRTFMPDEDKTPGAHPVVILSHLFRMISACMSGSSLRPGDAGY